MSFSILEPSSAVLGALGREQSGQGFSYPDVGATRGAWPPGYRHCRHEVELGRGEGVFDQASEGLRRWQAHLRSGARVQPEDTAVEGLTVIIAVRIAFVWASVACRIVYVTEQARRRGFAYGTLPHHVVEGEEAFHVERDDADVVRFVVSAFLRPRGPVLSAAGPVVHAVDQQLVRRYLRGLQAHVGDGPGTA